MACRRQDLSPNRETLGLAEPGWMAGKDCGLGPFLARSLFGFSALAMGELLRMSVRVSR